MSPFSAAARVFFPGFFRATEGQDVAGDALSGHSYHLHDNSKANDSVIEPVDADRDSGAATETSKDVEEDPSNYAADDAAELLEVDRKHSVTKNTEHEAESVANVGIGDGTAVSAHVQREHTAAAGPSPEEVVPVSPPVLYFDYEASQARAKERQALIDACNAEDARELEKIRLDLANIQKSSVPIISREEAAKLFAGFPKQTARSQQLREAMRDYTEVKAEQPRCELASHRYWIVVSALDQSNLKTKTAKRLLIWFMGNRVITVETIWRKYSELAAEENFSLLLAGRRLQFKEQMEELDLLNNHFIVLKCVRDKDLEQQTKPIVRKVLAKLQAAPVVLDA